MSQGAHYQDLCEFCAGRFWPSADVCVIMSYKARVTKAQIHTSQQLKEVICGDA